MRDSFIFYRSFFEAIIDLPKENQADIFHAICDYSLNFTEPKLEGVNSTLFKLIKPQLDANIQRYINGKQPKVKQEESEQEAKDKQTKSKTEANKNVNDNVNANHNENKELRLSQFQKFWDYYNVKSDRAKCEEKFLKLSESDLDMIRQTLPNYIAATGGSKPEFRKNPLTYINGKCWNDEKYLTPIEPLTPSLPNYAP